MQRLRMLARNATWIEIVHLGVLAIIFAIAAGVGIWRRTWDEPFIWTPLLFFAAAFSPKFSFDLNMSRRTRVALGVGVLAFAAAMLLAVLVAWALKAEWLAHLALSALIWFAVGEWFWRRSDPRGHTGIADAVRALKARQTADSPSP